MKKNEGLVLITIIIFLIICLIAYIVKDIKKDVGTPEYVASDTVMHVTRSETRDEIIYEVIDNARDLTYSWAFLKTEELEKSLKDNMNIDINLRLNLLNELGNKELDDLVTNEDKLIVSFDYHGELPTRAKIKIDVSDKYSEGESLYLYYLNEDKEQIEYVRKDIIVKNGHVEFEIEHCSNYFLTASIVQDAVNNPKNINLIIVVMVVVIIVLIAATLFQNKK